MDKEILDDPDSFFTKLHLYDAVKWEGEDVFKVVDLLYFSSTIDCFCVGCGKHSTFRGVNDKIPDELSRESYAQKMQLSELAMNMGGSKGKMFSPPTIRNNIYYVSFSCSRDTGHRIVYFYLVRDQYDNYGEFSQSIQKVGQYPSYASQNLPDLKRFRSVIDNDSLSELTKGVLLGSHDTAIGGFVYLRRVFEKLIKQAADHAISDGVITEDEFTPLRMNEKISAISEYLPSFIVEHPKLYSLLSKGVHELTEDECSRMFDVIKMSIEMILEQKLEDKNREKRLAEAKKQLQKTLQKH